MNKHDKAFFKEMMGIMVLYFCLACLLVLLVGCGQAPPSSAAKAAETIEDGTTDEVVEEPVEETDFEKLTGVYNFNNQWSRLTLNDNKTFELVHKKTIGVNVYTEKYTGTFDLVDGVFTMTKLYSTCPGDSIIESVSEFFSFEASAGAFFTYRFEQTIENNGNGFHVVSWWEAEASELYEPEAPYVDAGFACFMYRTNDILNTQFQQLGE